MTFLQGCDHDVFVSYAHGPVPLGQYSTVQQDPLSKWTHKFVDDLRGNIDFLLGFKDPQRRVEIWMDPALEGNQPLGANLKGKVERSALLLVAMSHFYLQSEWCGKEVEWFSDRIDTDGHLFVARVCPTQQEWPKALKDKDGNELPGYRFHPATEPGQLCNPYGWPRPTEDDKEYQAELTRLAHAITKQLQRLKWIERQNGEGHDFTSVPPSVGRTLFLGFMHDTLSDNGLRGELRAALVDKGITVLPPEADEPYDEASLRNAIAKYLDQSHGLIVVANEYGGYWPRGEDGGFFGYQLREARERKIPSHPWLLVDDLSQVRNPQYQAFLRRFESEAADHSNTVRYKDAFSFIAHIGQKLNNQEAGRPSTPDALVCPVNNPDGEVYREFQEIVLDAVASTGRIIYSPLKKRAHCLLCQNSLRRLMPIHLLSYVLTRRIMSQHAC
jgi:hypothetical protein